MRKELQRIATGWRRRLAEARKRPAGRLYVHFFQKMVRGSGEDSGESTEAGLGVILGLLASPAAFAAIMLFDKYGSVFQWLRRVHGLDPYVASLPDKYFFVVLSMVITGVLTVLRWDRLIPDRQDAVNLMPLPVAPRLVLGTNTMALLSVAVLFATDVNAAAVILFPMVVAAGSGFEVFLSFFGAHLVAVLLAGAFAFLAVFAVLGLPQAVLPRTVFQPLVRWLRTALMAALLALLLSCAAGPALVKQLRGDPDTWVRWIPSIWFVGLYQDLQGRADGALAQASQMAWLSLGAALTVAAFSYVVNYRRHYLGAAEVTASPIAKVVRAWRLPRVLVRGDLFARACRFFGWRVLLRSETHWLLLSSAAGLGLVLASQSMVQPDVHSLTALPMLVTYPLLVGMRMAFELPAEARANWLWKMLVNGVEHDPVPAAKGILRRAVVLTALIPALVEGWLRTGDFARTALHLAWVAVLCWVLIEILTLNLVKIPFTCTLPGFRNNLPVHCLGHLAGFALFTGGGASMELWMAGSPVRIGVLFGLVGGLAVYLSTVHERGEGDVIRYEDPEEPAMMRLDVWQGG
jgi:hypothetical protein